MGRYVYFSIVLLCVICKYAICQTTYTTVRDGNWSSLNTWASGIPPNPLPIGDSIIVDHGINYDINQVVLGVLLITLDGSVNSSGSDNLNIGRGGIGVGELINYGILTVSDLEVKPSNGCTPDLLGLPTVNNFGTIKTTDDLHVGNNCGAGSFYNRLGGKVFVADQMQVDNYLCNSDSIYIGNFIKIHGGTIDCCGYIEVLTLDIDANPSGRTSSLNCVIFCGQGVVAPTIDIGGMVFPSLNNAYLNANPAEASIDDDSTFICDFNQAGNPNSLPIELVSFRGEIRNEMTVELNWETALEINNDYYTVERSIDGINWEKIGEVQGSGTTRNLTYYTFLDDDPLAGLSYYRLKQTDFDLSFSYSKLIAIKLPHKGEIVSLYPNPTDGLITIRGSMTELEGLELYNMYGQNVNSLIEEKEHKRHYTRIDISNLSPAFYMLKTKNRTLRIHKK